ncbi:MAG: hypothetical protein ACK5LX_13875 [Oscillospiraceae bacterium]
MDLSKQPIECRGCPSRGDCENPCARISKKFSRDYDPDAFISQVAQVIERSTLYRDPYKFGAEELYTLIHNIPLEEWEKLFSTAICHGGDTVCIVLGRDRYPCTGMPSRHKKTSPIK